MPAASQTQDRSKALATALAQIDKSFGKGSVMRLGDESRPPVSVIPTGSVALDVALGVGGLPRGRIVDEGRVPAGPLRAGHGVQGDGGLSGGLRPVDLDDASPRESSDSQSRIEGD